MPKELRLEFESLCSMFEGRLGRQEAPAAMRSKLKCIKQEVEETLAEFGIRRLCWHDWTVSPGVSGGCFSDGMPG